MRRPYCQTTMRGLGASEGLGKTWRFKPSHSGISLLGICKYGSDRIFSFCSELLEFDLQMPQMNDPTLVLLFIYFQVNSSIHRKRLSSPIVSLTLTKPLEIYTSEMDAAKCSFIPMPFLHPSKNFNFFSRQQCSHLKHFPKLLCRQELPCDTVLANEMQATISGKTQVLLTASSLPTSPFSSFSPRIGTWG